MRSAMRGSIDEIGRVVDAEAIDCGFCQARHDQRRRGDGHIVVWGGVSFWRSLMRLDLIDEFRLDLHPYVAGEGTRLFDDVPKSYRLDLVSSTELDQRDAEQDPVRRLEARREHLDELAQHAATPTERDAVYAELEATCAELRGARRDRAADAAIERYVGHASEAARTTRITTLTR
jgi:RibD C-terminal domain